MAAPAAPIGPLPRLLKATYLAEREGLLRETRATALFYMPAPIFWTFVFLLLDYSAASAAWGWASVPYLTAGFSWIAGIVSGTVVVEVFVAITLLIVLGLVIRYLRWSSTIYAITTSRVIIQSGILGREFDEIPIPQVRGVDVKQSVGQRMLRYGSVTVSSEGGGGMLGNEEWKGIPHPFEFQRLIESAGQALMRGPASAAPMGTPGR